jgi:Ca2+-binding EF-hand superfamily protein
MRSISKMLAIAAIAGCAMALPAYADNMDAKQFITNCDMDKDGMVSKAEMMQMVEKAFDKVDKKKTGKLDKKQAEDFLKVLMQNSSG